MEYIEIELGGKENRIVGWFSLVIGIFSIMSIAILGGSIVNLIYMFAYFYVFYKTIVKKKSLTKIEWIAFFVLIFMTFILPLLILTFIF